jgi:hypothetical protein
MKTFCYIASPSYSGSTLLTLLLATHPQIATVGELKGRLYAAREVPRRCSCGRALRECPFWNALARRLAAEGEPCDLGDLDSDFHAPARPVVDALLRARTRGVAFEALRGVALRVWPGAQRELDRLRLRNRAVGEAICAIQRGDVLLDASKDAVRLAFLLDAGWPDVRVIHLLRDGRGTAHSFRERDGLPIRSGARRWRTAHESFRALFTRLGAGAVYVMRYEDLAVSPRAALAAALDFLGLPRGGVSLAFRANEHHVFGNSMRFEKSDEIRLDERWQHALSRRELAVFEREAGRLNRAFGYAP